MTLNQASRKLDSDLLLAVNGSGLPLRVVELQVINLLNAIQLRLRQEEEKEEADEAAEAAVALRTDDILVLDTLFINHDKPPLEMLGRSIEKMAEADAVIFAPDWKQAAGCRLEHLAASEYNLKVLHGKG